MSIDQFRLPGLPVDRDFAAIALGRVTTTTTTACTDQCGHGGNAHNGPKPYKGLGFFAFFRRNGDFLFRCSHDLGFILCNYGLICYGLYRLRYLKHGKQRCYEDYQESVKVSHFYFPCLSE